MGTRFESRVPVSHLRALEVKFEKERRELEAIIKQHARIKASAAQCLEKIAAERQGEVVMRLRRVVEFLKG